MFELELIEIDKFGRYKLTHQIISTGEKWKGLAVKQFQKQTLDLAKRSLDEHSSSQREISTLTFTAEKVDLDKIKDLTREYRKKIQQVIDDSENVLLLQGMQLSCLPNCDIFTL